MPNEMHTHNFSGVTTLNDGHLHHYSGVTGTAPNVPGHVHAMNRTTTVNDGHTHNYRLQTRQSAPIAGGHSHDYEASTSFTDGHNHNLGGTTSVYTDPAKPVQQIQFGFPFGQFRPGRPGPSGPPPSTPGQRPGNAPSTPPPSFIPREPSVTPFALDPGAVTPCKFRFSYIWPRRGQPFWAWIIFVGRRSLAGFRWQGRSWIYFAIDLRDIRSIQCF